MQRKRKLPASMEVNKYLSIVFDDMINESESFFLIVLWNEW